MLEVIMYVPINKKSSFSAVILFSFLMLCGTQLYAGPKNPVVSNYLDKEGYEAALSQILDGIEIIDGKYSDLNVQLDQTLVYINDPEVSESVYKRLVSLYPEEPIYLSGLGNTQILIGKKQDGRDTLMRYIKKWPDTTVSQDVRYGLAWGLYFDGDNEKALQIVTDYFKYGGTSYYAYRCEAFALYRLGRYDKAKWKLEKILSEDHSIASIPITEKLDIGGSDTESSRSIVYNVPSTLGWVNYHLGDMARARSIFSDLIQESPGWVDVIVGLGYVEVASGNMDEAQSQFNKALEIYPDYPDALYGLSILKEQ